MDTMPDVIRYTDSEASLRLFTDSEDECEPRSLISTKRPQPQDEETKINEGN